MFVVLVLPRSAHVPRELLKCRRLLTALVLCAEVGRERGRVAYDQQMSAALRLHPQSALITRTPHWLLVSLCPTRLRSISSLLPLSQPTGYITL